MYHTCADSDAVREFLAFARLEEEALAHHDVTEALARITHMRSSINAISDHSNDSTATRALLSIGIMSARQNFALRQAQRQTWLAGMPPQGAFHKFIIGEMPCAIHPHDRKDPYGCEPRFTEVPRFHQELRAHETYDGAVGNRAPPSTIGTDFRANFKVAVIALGLFDSKGEATHRWLVGILY